MSDNNSKPNNPPAFPKLSSKIRVSRDIEMIDAGSDGMSLRDYFAAKDMQSIILACYNTGERTYLADVEIDGNSTAKTAYDMADAMLKAREL